MLCVWFDLIDWLVIVSWIQIFPATRKWFFTDRFTSNDLAAAHTLYPQIPSPPTPIPPRRLYITSNNTFAPVCFFLYCNPPIRPLSPIMYSIAVKDVLHGVFGFPFIWAILPDHRSPPPITQLQQESNFHSISYNMIFSSVPVDDNTFNQSPA